MAKLTLADVSNLLGNPTSAATRINSNNDLIEAALEKTLSRDGTTPNQMLADIDLNNNDLLNVGTLVADTIILDGSNVSGLLEEIQELHDETLEAAEDAEAAALQATQAAAAATVLLNDTQDLVEAIQESFTPLVSHSFDATVGQSSVPLVYEVGKVSAVYMNGVKQYDWIANNGTTVTFPIVTAEDILPGETSLLVEVMVGTSTTGLDGLDARYMRRREGLISPFDYGGLGRGNLADNDTPAIIAAMNAALAISTDDRAAVDMTGGTWVCSFGEWAGHDSEENRYMVVIPEGKTVSFTGENWKILGKGTNRNTYFTPFLTSPNSHVIVDGCEYDYAYLPWTQGICISKTATSARFQLDTDTFGEPTFTEINRLSQYNPTNKVFSDTVLEESTYRTFTQVSPGVYDLDFSATGETAKLADVAISGSYVLIHKVRGYSFIQPDGGSVTLRNSVIRTSAGYCVAASNVQDVEITNVDLWWPTGSKRMITTTSDGYHFNGVSGKFIMNGFTIAGTSDDWLNVNVPSSNIASVNVGPNSLTLTTVAPSMIPLVGAHIIAVNESGGHVDLGYVTVVVGNTITLSVTLPSMTTNWKIMDATYICSPIVENWRVQNTVGSGVVRGIAPVIRGGDGQDTGSALISIIAFWAVYNEGPVVQSPIVQVTGRRCGLAPAAVHAAVQIWATTVVSPWNASPQGAIIGGNIQVQMQDCPNRSLYVSSMLGVYLDVTELNCAYNVWPALPNPLASVYVENSDFVNLFVKSNTSVAKQAVFKTCGANCNILTMGNITRVNVA